MSCWRKRPSSKSVHRALPSDKKENGFHTDAEGTEENPPSRFLTFSVAKAPFVKVNSNSGAVSLVSELPRGKSGAEDTNVFYIHCILRKKEKGRLNVYLGSAENTR